MKKIIFDVGANNGLGFKEAAREGHEVYAFEPTPELISHIKDWLSKDNLPTYHLIEKAVSLHEGELKFNILGRGDWGCSSLKDIQDDISIVWPGPNFGVSKTISVPVIRLDTFIKDNNIDRIDYLHIDTQGSDFDVLCSLGEQLDKVVEGVMEVPNTVKIYKNTNSKEESIAWLEANGFSITAVINDGDDGREQNVYFRNKKYGITSRPWVYSGKSHFKYPDSAYEPFFL